MAGASIPLVYTRPGEKEWPPPSNPDEVHFQAIHVKAKFRDP